MLGLIAGFVQERAGMIPLAREGVTFIPDLFLVLRAVFVKLRTEAAARALTDMKEYVKGEEARKLLAMFSVVPSMKSTFGTLQARETAWGRGRAHGNVASASQKILTAATWNVSGGQKSAQAPASWLLADQANAIVQEVLRWESDVVSLQEVSAADPWDSLSSWYSFVGASRSHRGFVHLYVARSLEFCDASCERPGVVACKVKYLRSIDDVLVEMLVAAVHLPAGMAKAKVRSRILLDIDREADESGVLILGDMNCKDDEAVDVCKKSSLREALYSGCSWGAQGNKFHEHAEYEGMGLRYDRILFSRNVWAESFLARERKTFFEGQEFFLSDHHAVFASFDCHSVFSESGRGPNSMAGARRVQISTHRDLRLKEEQSFTIQWNKQGREQKLCAQQHASEEQRVQEWKAQKQALLERDRKARQRMQAAFGAGSVWGGVIEEKWSRYLASVVLDGWQEDSWNTDIPTHVFLRGIVPVQGDVVMPCLLQVLLRLPAMQAWISMHREHCANRPGCALCWLRVVRDAMGSSINRRNLQVAFLPEGVGPIDVQDAKLVLEMLFTVLSESEIASGRIGEALVPCSRSVVVTHVDRLFGCFRETHVHCQTCGVKSQSSFLPRSRIVTLPVRTSLDQGCSVTDLYIDSCLSHVDDQICLDDCSAETKHAVASRLASTPEVLIFWLRRDSESAMIAVDIDEELLLPGLSPVRLVSVMYCARRPDGRTPFYSCSCRGPMDAWWYFEEGRAPEPIKSSISHIKRKTACLLFYERVARRGGALKRAGSTVGSKGAGENKRPRLTSLQPAAAGVLGEWSCTRRKLKRYPSWVDGLKLTSLRPERWGRAVEVAVDVFLREGRSEEGGRVLVVHCNASMEDEFETIEDAALFATTMLRVFERLRDDTSDPRLVSLYSEACLEVKSWDVLQGPGWRECVPLLEARSAVSGGEGVSGGEVVDLTCEAQETVQTVEPLVQSAEETVAQGAPHSVAEAKAPARRRRARASAADVAPVRRSARIASKASR